MKKDLISIKIKNDEFQQVSFSKFVKQSKYVRDKYTYPEAVKIIPNELKYLKKKYNMNENSIKYFIKYIDTDRIAI